MTINRTEQELCLVLDALGADGAAEYRSGASAEQIRTSIFTHVRWLELRARNAGRRDAQEAVKHAWGDAPVAAIQRRMENDS